MMTKIVKMTAKANRLLKTPSGTRLSRGIKGGTQTGDLSLRKVGVRGRHFNALEEWLGKEKSEALRCHLDTRFTITSSVSRSLILGQSIGE